MVVTVSWQVFSRYVLRAPSSLTEEIARFQLIWLGLLGAVYTFRNRMHVGIDILVASLTGKKRLAAELVSLTSVFIFAVLILVYGGGHLVLMTHELNQTSGALGIRMSYIYSVLPISGILICIYALDYIGDVVLKGKIHKPSELDPSELVTNLGQEG
ncbi:MAG: TRAP transporter small permease [Acidimicrobiales bacterium]|nr:TRAP transporter small permease [Hyphomonadaceae bacterium]RZV38315.1 MAG: TRAP transporter small permease [Acidimicrobiales bacterium]